MTSGNPEDNSFSARLDKLAKNAKRKSPPEPPAIEFTGRTPDADSFRFRLDRVARESGAAINAEPTDHDATEAPAPINDEIHDDARFEPRPQMAVPLGDGEREVRPGDCISSIAQEAGHFWETIWNDAANHELREARRDPNVLLPGDRITVPQIVPREEAGQTEMRHRFRRRGEPTLLRLRLLMDGQPRSREPFSLTVDGITHQGVTDADGNIQVPIPGGARRGLLIVGADDEITEHMLELGTLDPVNSIRGVQMRLNSLGFIAGLTDGVLGPRTRAAIEAFQARHRLHKTGYADETTQAKLKESYGA